MHIGTQVRLNREGRYFMRPGEVVDVITDRGEESVFIVNVRHKHGELRPVPCFREELEERKGD